ncbi:uncharacterized protein EI97DRAFT_150804 [Westerdykella ornata]|uniref:Uncharacterized protein n=1 Tax=Westerdykella ornata TaxID=318751 RepID=A0A6A6JAT7_WESOR|nr:uncharacterized protein EI97DRAFT_150804 [Westerdykella ornata]KAF2273711.1 hypothetical protein EI97DRAFT_150804 [Westerdykella ornata]
MKKATSISLFVASVTAHYGYGAPSTSSKLGYTTIYPGHGEQPVTVTAQYQPVPTYVNGRWSSYEAISTVITDIWGNKITVTKADQDLTVYHTKKTLTHTVTVTNGAGGYAKPTGYYGLNSTSTNSTSTKTWYELYEEIREVPYNHVGPHAIPGYSGNPRCEDKNDEQSVTIKQYSGGQWKTYAHTFTYSAPKPSVTSYDAPGTYTIPANDITVQYPTTVAVEHTYPAEANKPVTYGGQTTDVTKPTTITAAYAAYETQGTVTKTVVHTKTITCNKPGKYTIHKPTTTVYAHDTTITYPSVTEYPAGVYHHPAETVTITKAHQPYTCKFEQTSTYPVPSSVPSPTGQPGDYEHPEYPAYTPTPTEPEHPDPSSDHEEPAEDYGHANVGYVKRGGVLQRLKAESAPVKARGAARRVILV